MLLHFSRPRLRSVTLINHGMIAIDIVDSLRGAPPLWGGFLIVKW